MKNLIMVKRHLLFIFLLCAGFLLRAQISASAAADTGSSYTAILTSGLNIENSDCEHLDLGPHITQAYDAEINRNVFVFHSHIDDDNDRCIIH